MTALRTWLQNRSHILLTTIAFVLAAGVSVLVNVWTEGWKWPVGVGIVVLIACQIVVEVVRTTPNAEPQPQQRSTVDQEFDDVQDSDVTGISRALPGGDAEVQQRFRNVDNCQIIGLSEGNRS